MNSLPLQSGLCLLAFAGLPVLTARAVTIFTTDGVNLVQFDSATPGNVTVTPVSGLISGEVVLGIDAVPGAGRIYALAGPTTLPVVDPNDPNTWINRFYFYSINPASGSASQVQDTHYWSDQAGADLGFDYNPGDGKIWLMVSNSVFPDNFGINPITGDALVEIPVGALGGPAPGYVAGSAYSAAGLVYFINSQGELASAGYETLKTVTKIGSLGLGDSLNPEIGFDIYHPTGEAFASITVNGVSQLYSINLATGQASSLGVIGDGTVSYGGLTVVPEPSAAVLGLGAALGFLRRRR